MNIINITLGVDTQPCSSITLGRRGENEVTQVVVDFSSWVEEFGAGVITLLAMRSQDTSAYPVVLTLDGNTATWDVTSTDTAYKGSGRAEYVYTVGEQIAKSVVFNTVVMQDIGEPSETPPDPYEEWLERLTELGAETQANAEAAQQSAEEAEQSAQEAAQEAANAEGYAEQAGESASAAQSAEAASESARDEAQTAQASAEASATAAIGSAASAAGSATSAVGSASDASSSASAASASASAASASATTASNAATAAQTAQIAAEDAAEDAQQAAQQAHVEYEQLSGEVDDLSDEVSQQKSALSKVINNLTYEISGAQTYRIEFSLIAGKTYNIMDKGSTGQFTMHTRATSTGENLESVGTFRAGETKQFTPSFDAEWLVGYANSATTIYIAEAGLIDSDVEELNKKSDIHDSQIQYTLEEVQKYADSGKQRLPGFWRSGNIINGALNSNVKYRAVSQLQHFDRDITLSIKTGYRFVYVLSDSDGTYTTQISSWYTTEHTITEGTYFYVVVGEVPEDVSKNIDPNLLASTIVIDTEIWSSIVHLNRGQEQMVYNLKHGRSTRFNDAYSPLEFIHFSDIHASKKLWSRLCDYMDKYSSVIPFALHTGDYVKASQLQYVDLYATQKPVNGYILNCVGNHDTYLDNNGSSIATAEQTYSLLFNDTSGWNVTFGTVTDAMYYYKDFTSYGIRLIVLDQYYWDSTQNTWFVNLLDDAKTNNLAVITASHVSSAALPLADRIDCTFDTADPWTQETTASLVPDIETAIVNYKNSGGEHVCHLCGHYHHDIIGTTANGILNISVECATNDGANWIDSERVKGTKGFDCFNVISVDRALKTIRLVRIGNNVDYNGQKKNVLNINYGTGAVVVNY